MSKERHAFVVTGRPGDDFIMLELDKPTDDRHDLSFIGAEILPAETAEDSENESLTERAAATVRREIERIALSVSRISLPKIVTYHNKVGYFFEAQTPVLAELPDRLAEGRIISQSRADVLEALREDWLLRLSAVYAERFMQ